MNTESPAWATLRSTQVRDKLPHDQRGPWLERQNCAFSIPGHDETMHKAEPPYFWYCTEHIKVVRRTHPQETTSTFRDQGLCVSCGEPAELRPEKKQDRVAAALAESTNSTIARVRTKGHCVNCNPRIQPICQGETCRKAGQQFKVLTTKCCLITRKIADRHCEMCCTENREALRAQNRSANGRKGGLASGASAKRRKKERRRKVSKLTQSKMNATDIAQQLKVSYSTINSDLRAINEQTRAARETNKRTWRTRQLAMQELQNQGLTEHEIAKRMGCNVRTVRDNLKAMQEAR